MKRITTIFMILFILVCFTACSNKLSEKDKNSTISSVEIDNISEKEQFQNIDTQEIGDKEMNQEKNTQESDNLNSDNNQSELEKTENIKPDDTSQPSNTPTPNATSKLDITSTSNTTSIPDATPTPTNQNTPSTSDTSPTPTNQNAAPASDTTPTLTQTNQNTVPTPDAIPIPTPTNQNAEITPDATPTSTRPKPTPDDLQKPSNIPQPVASPQPEQDEPLKSNILVVYFSCSNTTKGIAEYISNKTGGTLYEIVAAEPYTEDDLKYYTDCRADKEQADPLCRPEISGSVSDISSYDIVFIGYPIWHGQAPRIISTFLESYDFSGKTIIPFCTSHSSGIGSSDTNLHNLALGANWISGKHFSASTSETEVIQWIDSLELQTVSSVSSFNLALGKNGNAHVVMLNSGYIDMMLLHHPCTNDVEAYHAIEKFVEEGKIRSIGLSNWYIEEIDDFIA